MRPTEKAYYEQRARESDDWWNGTGLFAARERPGWHEEVAELTAVLEQLAPARTLDVACGTGFLTSHLPGELTGLDQSASMLAIARERVPGADFVRADVPPLPFADASSSARRCAWRTSWSWSTRAAATGRRRRSAG